MAGQSYCDWCFAELTASDRAELFNGYLNEVDAYACSRCIRVGRVLQPPDSLEVDEEQRAAWEAGAVAIYDGQVQDRILPLLRQAAGFDADNLGMVVVIQDRLWGGDPRFGGFRVRVDGRRAGIAPVGGRCFVTVKPGTHPVRIRQWWYQSPSLVLDIHAGQTIRLKADIDRSAGVFRRMGRLLFKPWQSLSLSIEDK